MPQRHPKEKDLKLPAILKEPEGVSADECLFALFFVLMLVLAFLTIKATAE